MLIRLDDLERIFGSSGPFWGKLKILLFVKCTFHISKMHLQFLPWDRVHVFKAPVASLKLQSMHNRWREVTSVCSTSCVLCTLVWILSCRIFVKSCKLSVLCVRKCSLICGVGYKTNCRHVNFYCYIPAVGYDCRIHKCVVHPLCPSIWSDIYNTIYYKIIWR